MQCSKDARGPVSHATAFIGHPMSVLMGGASNEHKGHTEVNAELNMAAMLHRNSCNGF